jgi:hypothetical protein
VVLFAGGWSGPVTGDPESVCFRFKDVGVGADAPVPEPEPEVCVVDAEPGGCGTVLCCFRGELLADGGAFWGVDGVCWELDGGLVGGGTLEYKVTAGVGFAPLSA